MNEYNDLGTKIARNLLLNHVCYNCNFNFGNICGRERLLYGSLKPMTQYSEEKTCINWQKIT